jgi:cytochrome c-type biogenesis protein CcmH
VTGFITVSAAMLAAAVLWIVVPLLRAKPPADAPANRKEQLLPGVAIALLVPVIAIAMYAGLSKWDWDASEAAAAQTAEIDRLLRNLQDKLADNPNDIKSWLLLGNSYRELGRYPLAVDAFQNAYDRTQGRDVTAIISLAEALVLTDPASLTGRAGGLFEDALAQAPNHPKALWYGSIAALQAGDLKRGRDRLQLLLAQNPPQQMRDILERQIQDLDEQLSEAGPSEAGRGTTPTPPAAAAGGEQPPAASGSRTIRVAVSLAPNIREQLKEPLLLFVLARDPQAGGPPLAVQRRNSSELPLTIELSERDAMMPTRTIASVPRVQVVARLSRSGTPQAQSGDFYGEGNYDFATGGGTLNIMIDRTVP